MEIGDYARTKKGDFGRIDYIAELNISIKLTKNISLCTAKENIISSKDLFNVLFPGDYINGKEGGRIKAKVTDKFGRYFLVGHNGIYFPENVTQVVTMEKKKEMDKMKKDLREKSKELKELKEAAKEFERNSIYIL